MKAYFLKLFTYDLWAFAQLLETVRSHQIEDETILLWLNHVLNAQANWYNRCGEEIYTRGVWELVPNDQLATDARDFHEKWTALITETDDAAFERMIDYQNSTGTAYQSSLQDILAHVINHGTHHRAQIAARLREMGIAPPPTDYVFWVRG